MRLLLIFPLLVCLTWGDPVAEADAEAEADAVADADAEADPVAQILYGQAGGPGSYQGPNYGQMNPSQGPSIEPMLAMNQMNLPTGNHNARPITNWGDVYNNFETSGNSLQPPLMTNPMAPQQPEPLIMSNPMASQQPEAPIMSNPSEGNMEVNGQGQMFTRSYTPLPGMMPGQRCYNMCRHRPNYWPNTSCRPVCNVRPACNNRRPLIDYRVRGRTVFCRPRRYPYYSCGSNGCGGNGYYGGGNGGSGYNGGSSGDSGYNGGSSGGSGYNGGSSGGSGYYGGGSGYNPGCQSSGSCGGGGCYGGSCGGGGYNGASAGTNYYLGSNGGAVAGTRYYLGSNNGGAQGINHAPLESSNSGSSQSATASEIQVTEVN